MHLRIFYPSQSILQLKKCSYCLHDKCRAKDMVDIWNLSMSSCLTARFWGYSWVDYATQRLRPPRNLHSSFTIRSAYPPPDSCWLETTCDEVPVALLRVLAYWNSFLTMADCAGETSFIQIALESQAGSVGRNFESCRNSLRFKSCLRWWSIYTNNSYYWVVTMTLFAKRNSKSMCWVIFQLFKFSCFLIFQSATALTISWHGPRKLSSNSPVLLHLISCLLLDKLGRQASTRLILCLERKCFEYKWSNKCY